MQPPSACILEINMKGVKIIVQDECRTSERVCPLLYTDICVHNASLLLVYASVFKAHVNTHFPFRLARYMS